MRRPEFKQRKVFRSILISSGLAIFLLLPLFLIWRFNFFAIKNVDVKISKINCAGEDQIKDASNLLGQNFFLVNKDKTESLLKKEFLCIRSINLIKGIPDYIKLEAEGREPLAKLLSLKEIEATTSSLIENIATPSAGEINEVYIVDSEGVVFSKESEAEIPKIFISSTSFSLGQILNENLKNSLKILDNLKKFGLSPQDSSVHDQFLVTHGTPKIIFRLDEKLDLQTASLQLILKTAKIESNNLEFIDLRFDKPIVKFAPKK